MHCAGISAAVSLLSGELEGVPCCVQASFYGIVLCSIDIAKNTNNNHFPHLS